MGAAVEQEIRVKIKALVDGLKSVQELQSAVKSLQSQGSKKLGVDVDSTKGANFLGFLRELSPTIDANISKAEALGQTVGLTGAQLTGAAVGAGVLVAAVAGVVAVVGKAVHSFEEYGSHIRDLEEETGAGAETLTTLDAGLQLAGKSIDDAIPGIDVFLRKLSEVANGNKETGKTFEHYGITQKVAQEAVKDTDGAVRLLLDTLSKYPNAAQRLEAANDLAGKSGKVLARAVEEMGGDFGKFMETAREWGIVLSEDDVRAADKFGDAVTVMGFKVKGILFEIARGALPELQKAVDDATGRINEGGDAWRNFGRDAGSAIGGAIGLMVTLNEKLQAYLKYRAVIHAILESNTPGEAASKVQDVTLEGVVPKPPTYVRDPKALATFKQNLSQQRDLSFGGEAGGGRKGGGGKSLAEKLRELRDKEDESELALRKARQDAGFDLFKDDMDREQKLLAQKLQDRLISIAAYYAQVAKLQTASIDNELARQKEAAAASVQEYNRALEKINSDPKKTEAEKAIERQTARNKMLGEQAKIEGEITKLNRDRSEVEARTTNEARKTTEEYQRQLTALQDELLQFKRTDRDDVEAPSVTAARHAIDERFREVRERAVAQAAATGDATGVAIIDALKQRLVKKAQFDAVEQQIRDVFQRIRDAEDDVDAAERLGGIGPKEAEQLKLKAARDQRAELERLHSELKGIAETTKDPELLAAVDRLKVEISQVGVAVDTLAQDINRDLKQALDDTLFAIIRRKETLKQAITDLANHILDELARLASSAIVEKLFGENGIFGGIFNSKGGQGGIGGILSGIFNPNRNTRGNPQTPQGNVSIFDTLPGVIKNFQSGTTGGLREVNQSTKGVGSEVAAGTNRIGSQLDTVISILPNLAPAGQSVWAALLQKGIEVAGALAQAKIAKSGQPQGQPHALGGLVNAVAGGRLIQVAEGGYDELVVSTDPKHRERTAGLLARFIQRTGIVPDFRDHGARLAASFAPRLPGLATGDFVSNLPALDLSAAGATVINQNFSHTYQVQGDRLTRDSEAAIERNAARLTKRGAQRSIASNK